MREEHKNLVVNLMTYSSIVVFCLAVFAIPIYTFAKIRKADKKIYGARINFNQRAVTNRALMYLNAIRGK